MNLNKQISELQEKNKARIWENLSDSDSLWREVDNAITDTAHAVALAVIGEIKKDLEARMEHEDYVICHVCDETVDHLYTLEAKIKDTNSKDSSRSNEEAN